MTFRLERLGRLDWPPGWQRTPAPKPAAFDMSYDRACATLREEIRRLGGRDAVLTHNPFQQGADPRDPGVALYFNLKQGRKVFACDRWQRVRDNVRAIALSIEAMRGLARWGASDLLERAFTGFEALPPPPSCWDVLDLAPGASRDEIWAAHRRLVLKHHPDRGGSPSKTAEINAARDAALKLAGG